MIGKGRNLFPFSFTMKERKEQSMINPITYVLIKWKNRETALTTPCNATNLNHMDDGIAAATEKVNEIASAVNAMTQDVTAGITVVDSEEDLPEVGVAGRLYLVKESEEE